MIAAIALDLGTTSIKAGLLDDSGALAHIVAHHAPRILASGGRYESDALAYATIAEQTLHECAAHESFRGAGSCKALGLCSQRSSFLIWERDSGEPVTPLISWQDNRGAASCEALRAHENTIRNLTGLPLAPYYFGPKLRVVLGEKPQWRVRLERRELLAGTLDTFLIWRWTGGAHFVTDASMAARTLLMDAQSHQWSSELCGLFGMPPAMLPEIKPSAGLDVTLDIGLNLRASVADQSAALFASVRESPDEALVNLGTGCFVTRHMLPAAPLDASGYLHTLAYLDGAHRAHFAIEGTLNSVAAALDSYPVGECETEDLGSNDIFCIAEPSGLGAPYFRGDIGLHFSSPVEHLTKREIASLLLEAVVFRVARILEEFHRLSPVRFVYLSGGLSGLSCLQQGIARCAPFAEVYRLEQAESSLRGAALLAAGMAPACKRRSERIQIVGNADVLPEKYRRWKKWLDHLLTA